MYSAKVSFIIGGMVLTGAARSVTAKLFFQLGFNYPLFLTLLYLAGQSLSLIPYNIWVRLRKSGYEFVWDEQTLFPRLKRQSSSPDHSQISDSSKRSYRTRPSIADHANPDWEEEKEEEENNQSALQLPSLTYDTEQGQGETSTLDRIDIAEKDQNEDSKRRKSSVTFAVSDDNNVQIKATSDYHIIDIEENHDVVEGQKRRKSSVRFSSDEPTSQNNSSALIEESNGCDDDNYFYLLILIIDSTTFEGEQMHYGIKERFEKKTLLDKSRMRSLNLDKELCSRVGFRLFDLHGSLHLGC